MMKKSKKIQLVLITAVLASCNRDFVPTEPVNRHLVDSALTAAPANNIDSNYNEAPICNCQAYSDQLWNYSFNPFGYYFYQPAVPVYYNPGNAFRGKIGWHGNKVIVRGGFGKTGAFHSIIS